VVDCSYLHGLDLLVLNLFYHDLKYIGHCWNLGLSVFLNNLGICFNALKFCINNNILCFKLIYSGCVHVTEGSNG
jgi:hypothetical protein